MSRSIRSCEPKFECPTCSGNLIIITFNQNGHETDRGCFVCELIVRQEKFGKKNKNLKRTNRELNRAIIMRNSTIILQKVKLIKALTHESDAKIVRMVVKEYALKDFELVTQDCKVCNNGTYLMAGDCCIDCKRVVKTVIVKST